MNIQPLPLSVLSSKFLSTHTHARTHIYIYIYTILKSGIVTTTQKNPKPSSPGCDEVTVTPLAC